MVDRLVRVVTGMKLPKTKRTIHSRTNFPQSYVLYWSFRQPSLHTKILTLVGETATDHQTKINININIAIIIYQQVVDLD
jgi:hypothetical protein